MGVRKDGFKTVYADISQYLEVADHPPDSRTPRTRLSQLSGDLKRFVFRPRTSALRCMRSPELLGWERHVGGRTMGHARMARHHPRGMASPCTPGEVLRGW